MSKKNSDLGHFGLRCECCLSVCLNFHFLTTVFLLHLCFLHLTLPLYLSFLSYCPPKRPWKDASFAFLLRFLPSEHMEVFMSLQRAWGYGVLYDLACEAF